MDSSLNGRVNVIEVAIAPKTANGQGALEAA
jgi:hypothetical protein